MKKQLSGLLAILTILGACQKNEVASLSEEATIHAMIEDNDVTKTIMDESNNILWSENDQIIAFMKSSYGHKYQVKPSFVGKSYADFSMVSSGNGNDLSAGNAWEHNVVYYPYSEDIECLKSGANYELEVNLPSEQVYAPDSFANGSMAMVAVSENNNITFNNVLGGIKLQLKGTQTVASIKIEGKNNEKLSGSATITAYTDETKPAITMVSSASTSVTLNCGEGVQLNESKATEFIISLPPVLFSKGFTVDVTDTEDNTYTVESTVTNTILRSSVLVMPAFKLGDLPTNDKPDQVYVSMIYIDKEELTMAPNTSYTLETDIYPSDATNKELTWSSSESTVAIVDKDGTITAMSGGTTIVTAVAFGGVSQDVIVKVVVNSLKASKDYIDEYGVNHGKGVAIGTAVWAPVNCGYKTPNGDNKGFEYGKLYQWGRKYGQGYSLDYDESTPDYIKGPVMPSVGTDESNANIFYYTDSLEDDWSKINLDNAWNSGTEEHPVKTENDPCPEGWRIPTEKEIIELSSNYSAWTSMKAPHSNTRFNGRYFSGIYTYIDNAPKIFMIAAGQREYDTETKLGRRGEYGYYWSCTPSSYLRNPFDFSKSGLNNYFCGMASGCSIRCVQE